MAASSLHKLFSLIVLLFLVMQPFSVAGKQVDQETRRRGNTQHALRSTQDDRR